MVSRIKDNLPIDKPFLLLEGKAIDFLKAIGANLKYLHICPRCGVPVSATTRVIYIAVNDTLLCGKCAEKWLEVSRWYSEDSTKEIDNYNKMVQKLKDSKLWKE